ncbi:unnamed protein product, partial [Nezara viridula]
SGATRHFREALVRCTGNTPPFLFCKKTYIGNCFDIVNASRFGRLDLLLEPPACPCYHIIVIGSGPGAQSVIMELAERGVALKVAVVDISSKGSLETIPRSLLWNALKAINGNDSNDFSESDIFGDLEVQDDIGLELICEAAGIDYYQGSVKFLSADVIAVSANCDDVETSSSDDEHSEPQEANIVGMSFIICCGCQPLIPEFPGYEHCISLDTFLHTREIPERAVIIGDSPEVVETAHLIAKCGGGVTVLIVFRVQNGSKYSGIYDKIIIHKNRVPMTDNMDLEKADVKVSKRSRKLIVNEAYRSTNKNIWAFGSVANGHPEDPRFEILAARSVVDFIINGVDDVSVPIVFPFILMAPLEYACCGETEKSALLRFTDEIIVNDSQNYFFHIKLICVRHRVSSSEVEIRKEDDRVVGIHILGHNMCSLISGLDELIEEGVTKEVLIEVLIQNSAFRKLKLNRISFSSRKSINTAYCGIRIQHICDINPETGTSSVFVKSWDSTSEESSDIDERTDQAAKNKCACKMSTQNTIEISLTGEEIGLRLFLFIWPIFLTLLPTRLLEECRHNVSSVSESDEDDSSMGNREDYNFSTGMCVKETTKQCYKTSEFQMRSVFKDYETIYSNSDSDSDLTDEECCHNKNGALRCSDTISDSSIVQRRDLNLSQSLIKEKINTCQDYATPELFNRKLALKYNETMTMTIVCKNVSSCHKLPTREQVNSRTPRGNFESSQENRADSPSEENDSDTSSISNTEENFSRRLDHTPAEGERTSKTAMPLTTRPFTPRHSTSRPYTPKCSTSKPFTPKSSKPRPCTPSPKTARPKTRRGYIKLNDSDSNSSRTSRGNKPE